MIVLRDHVGLSKGYSLLSYVTPLQRDKSALWGEVEELLPAEARDFFRGTVYANDWYPRSYFHALMEAFHAAVHDDAAEVRELGAMGARFQVHVIYRLFLKFATPAMVFRRAASVWSRQSTVGSFAVVDETDDYLLGQLDDPDLPMGLAELMCGWSDTMIALLGRTPYPTTWEKAGPQRWRFRVSWLGRGG
jgi:hypothetical protein